MKISYLQKYITHSGKLDRIFYWKCPAKSINYHHFRYRHNGLCPVCSSTILTDYGCSHNFSDEKHSDVHFVYYCVFCGFNSSFKRSRGFDNFRIFSSNLHKFSLFKTEDLNKHFNKIKSQSKLYELYTANSIEKMDFKIVFIKNLEKRYIYAVKITNNINFKKEEVEAIEDILYPEIKWDEKIVNILFSERLNVPYSFEEAQRIFDFIGCYNKSYPPFYEISDEFKKQIICHNAKYYFKKAQQYKYEAYHNGKLIYSENRDE